MRMRRICILGVGLTLTLAVAPFVWVGTMPAQQEGPAATGNEKPGHGKRAQAFIDAFNRGDARAVAGFWTPDGNYTDQVGQKYKGRAALEKLYAKVFAQNKGAKLTIHVGSIRKLSPDVVIEEGVNEVTPADGGPPTSAAFTAVVVKHEGQWHFESVQETIARPPSNAEHFEGLEWLIGEWMGEETKGESARSSYAWAENKNFIVSHFATTLNGVPMIGGTQWIAWDAVDKQIRSYSFYSGGGVGEGLWTNDGKSWTIKTSAKTADGKRVSAINVVTRVDADHATWQLTNVNVDGKAMPDARAVRLKRVRADRPQ